MDNMVYKGTDYPITDRLIIVANRVIVWLEPYCVATVALR